MTDAPFYSLIRSRRKTIAIHISKDAAVEVRAPLKMSKADIDRFVISKQAWISRHMSESVRRAENKAAFTLKYGDSVYLAGQAYPILARDGDRAGFDGERIYLPPGMPPDGIKRAVIEIYRKLAKQLLEAKADEFAKRMGVKPSAVKVNGAKTRWGSCSGKNSLNFSWRLIMADESVIDYVVVHELAHIREHNHSDRFWAIVASVLPDYKSRQVKLKELQKRLAGEDWD